MSEHTRLMVPAFSRSEPPVGARAIMLGRIRESCRIDALPDAPGPCLGEPMPLHGGRERVLNPAQDLQAAALQAKGFTYREIAAEMGCGKYAAIYAVKRVKGGVRNRRSDGGRGRPRKRSISAELEARLLALSAEGMGTQALADALGCGIGVVRHVLAHPRGRR